MKFTEKRPLYQLEELARILHSEEGCPWDREQTHETLKKYLVEESYEVIDAIESNDRAELREELGDVLYQIYAHSEIADDFSIDDVALKIVQKLISRHPHVFGDESAASAGEVADNWEKIKKEERKTKHEERRSILAGVPNHLPALLKAYRVQEKVSRVGFDFPDMSDTVAKLEEELEELKAAFIAGNKAEVEDEFGDILFSIVNVARFAKLDPEECLRRSVEKFMTRFSHVEKKADSEEKRIDEYSLEELEAMWQEAKQK